MLKLNYLKIQYNSSNIVNVIPEDHSNNINKQPESN